MYKHTLILVLSLILFAGISVADIINIPDDTETIQAGIDAAEDGDTVLVQPGEYVENIAFGNNSIVVGSLTLTTRNPAYIDSTVINGNSNGRSVVSFREDERREPPNPTLTGFTIINGRTDYGGGIYINNALPTLTHLRVMNNEASQNGGGIYVSSLPNDAELIFSNIEVDNNSSEWIGGGIYSYSANGRLTLYSSIISNNQAYHGGGFYLNRHELVLSSVIVSDNSAQVFGGGGYCDGLSDVTIENSEFISNNANSQGGGLAINECENVHLYRTLFSNNSAGDYGGGAYIAGSTAELVNVTVFGNEARGFCGGIVFNAGGEARISQSIFWSNGGVEIGCRPGGVDNEIIIGYSLIQSGEGGVELNESGDLEWLEGNIDEDPQFVDAEEGDFHLTEDSPCIDAGDPDSDPDPDGTRADIGMFPFMQGTLTVEGYVLDAANDRPLENAMITSSDGTITYSDSSGFWRFSPLRLGLLDLAVSAFGYLDSLLQDIEVNLDDTLSITFRLLHAELEASIENIVAELAQGEREEFTFNIANPGNGVLDWSVETRYRGDVAHDPWELRRSYPFGEQLDDSRLYGVAYIDSLFYVTGTNDDNPTIYILNRNGEFIDTVEQPWWEDDRGMKDITYDGRLLWGTMGNTIYGINLNGDVIESFDAPYNPTSLITWDSDRELLWVCHPTRNPVAVDREGNRIEGMEIDRNGLRLSGLAYFAEDRDNAPLYLLSKERGTNRQTIHKYNFEIEDTIFVTYLDPEEGGSPQGAYITDQFVDFNWTFISVADDRGGDRVDIWQLDVNTSWSLIDPSEGSLIPEEDQDIFLTINASGLAPMDYPAELIFSHNGFGLETIIPIDLTVMPLGVEDQNGALLQLEFAITAAFPNPFNSTTTIEYALPFTSHIMLNIYNLSGRRIETLVNGRLQAGMHRTTLDAGDMASGVYFVRFQSGSTIFTKKTILTK